MNECENYCSQSERGVGEEANTRQGEMKKENSHLCNSTEYYWVNPAHYEHATKSRQNEALK